MPSSSASPAFLYTSFRYWRAVVRCPSGWTAPTLSACLHMRNALSFWSSSLHSSSLSPADPHHSYVGDHRAGQITPVSHRVPWGQRSWIPSLTLLPRCFQCSPGCSWLSGLRAHIAGSCWTSHQPVQTQQFKPQTLIITDMPKVFPLKTVHVHFVQTCRAEEKWFLPLCYLASHPRQQKGPPFVYMKNSPSSSMRSGFTYKMESNGIISCTGECLNKQTGFVCWVYREISTMISFQWKEILLEA